ncbi:hypothetical protein ACOSQ2_010865 [Xanthoceras sorbifolium]
MQVPMLCPCYQKLPETILHALFFYGSLKEVRAQCSFLPNNSSFCSSFSSFLDMFMHCCFVLKANDMRLWMVVIWCSWFRRNGLVYSGTPLLAVDIVSWSINFIKELDAA